jgi:hypothetical protein
VTTATRVPGVAASLMNIPFVSGTGRW